VREEKWEGVTIAEAQRAGRRDGGQDANERLKVNVALRNDAHNSNPTKAEGSKEEKQDEGE